MSEKYTRSYEIIPAKKGRPAWTRTNDITKGKRMFKVFERESQTEIKFHVGLEKGKPDGLWITVEEKEMFKNKETEKVCPCCKRGTGEKSVERVKTRDQKFHFNSIRGQEAGELIEFLKQTWDTDWSGHNAGKRKTSRSSGC